MWWRVYYGDGSVFSDAEGSPFDAPRADVQAIAQEKSPDFEVVHGRDYFYWEPERGGWHSSDIFGAFDHLIRAPRQCLLFGRMLSDEAWRALFARVKADAGERSGRYARERHRG